jgi:hypothetical protein
MDLKVANRKNSATLTLVLSIAFLMFSNGFSNTYAQTVTSFTPADKFHISELNGSISFAVNGSYSEATLQNNTWAFKDLTLNIQNIPYFELNGSHSFGDLKFSTQDSNVTIWACLSLNYTSLPMTMIGYSAEGKGEQTVNLGLSLARHSDVSEWSILVPNEVFVAAGDGWVLLPDDTLLITCAASNVTIIYFSFIDSIDGTSIFYLQHSVAIFTAAVSTVVVGMAAIVKVRRRKKALR